MVDGWGWMGIDGEGMCTPRRRPHTQSGGNSVNWREMQDLRGERQRDPPQGWGCVRESREAVATAAGVTTTARRGRRIKHTQVHPELCS